MRYDTATNQGVYGSGCSNSIQVFKGEDPVTCSIFSIYGNKVLERLDRAINLASQEQNPNPTN